LGLDSYAARIDDNYEKYCSRRRRKFDRQKMKELMDVWQKASPITYTKSRYRYYGPHNTN
jgi:hypothetical protein